MSNTAYFQRGNSFAATFGWTPGATGPANLLATTLSSVIKDKCGTEYALTVTKAGDGLSFTVAYPGSTSDWELGQHSWDIKFVFPGSPVSHSEMFRVIVEDTVTP
jgi:hypothetical protein